MGEKPGTVVITPLISSGFILQPLTINEEEEKLFTQMPALKERLKSDAVIKETAPAGNEFIQTGATSLTILLIKRIN